ALGTIMGVDLVVDRLAAFFGCRPGNAGQRGGARSLLPDELTDALLQTLVTHREFRNARQFGRRRPMRRASGQPQENGHTPFSHFTPPQTRPSDLASFSGLAS